MALETELDAAASTDHDAEIKDLRARIRKRETDRTAIMQAMRDGAPYGVSQIEEQWRGSVIRELEGKLIETEKAKAHLETPPPDIRGTYNHFWRERTLCSEIRTSSTKPTPSWRR